MVIMQSPPGMTREQYDSLFEERGAVRKSAETITRTFELRWGELWMQSAMGREDIIQELIGAVIAGAGRFNPSHGKGPGTSGPARSPEEQFIVFSADIMRKAAQKLVRRCTAGVRKPRKRTVRSLDESTRAEGAEVPLWTTLPGRSVRRHIVGRRPWRAPREEKATRSVTS